MKVFCQLCVTLTLAALMALAPTGSSAQSLTGPPADPQYKYSTPMPPGIAVPDSVDTRLGTLHFFDGFPDKATPTSSGTPSTSSALCRRICWQARR